VVSEVTHGITTINRTTAAEFVMRLPIIGATGGTGLQVTSQAVEGGHRVTAYYGQSMRISGSFLFVTPPATIRTRYL
jgi:hypothetical protein